MNIFFLFIIFILIFLSGALSFFITKQRGVISKSQRDKKELEDKLKKAQADIEAKDAWINQARWHIQPELVATAQPPAPGPTLAEIQQQQAFFSSAVHDLRAPLTVTRLATSLLLQKFDTFDRAKIIEHLKLIDGASLDLVNLINNILSISRIEQGRLEVEKKPFDIERLSDEVIAELSEVAKERKLYLRHQTEGGNRMVIGDQVKSKEVLMNLLTNALKYTIQGGVTITHQELEGFIVTKVTDTGAGVPKESQSLLFQKFMQVGYARTQSTSKSSGLGLYISKKIAQAMGGDVVLESSEPGKGSTFAFRLPVG